MAAVRWLVYDLSGGGVSALQSSAVIDANTKWERAVRRIVIALAVIVAPTTDVKAFGGAGGQMVLAKAAPT